MEFLWTIPLIPRHETGGPRRMLQCLLPSLKIGPLIWLGGGEFRFEAD